MQYKIGNYFIDNWRYDYLFQDYDTRDIIFLGKFHSTIYISKYNTRYYIKITSDISDRASPITLLYTVYNRNSSFANMELAKQFVDNFFERLQKLNVFL